MYNILLTYSLDPVHTNWMGADVYWAVLLLWFQLLSIPGHPRFFVFLVSAARKFYIPNSSSQLQIKILHWFSLHDRVPMTWGMALHFLQVLLCKLVFLDKNSKLSMVIHFRYIHCKNRVVILTHIGLPQLQY